MKAWLKATSSEQQAVTGRPAAPKTATEAVFKNSAQKTQLYCPDYEAMERAKSEHLLGNLLN